nr:hypothetical protein [uncultured Holophaga sp.]
MTTYRWRGPMTTKAGMHLRPGMPVDLDPSEPLVQGYLELGYLEAVDPAPETPKKTKTKKGDA